jgi:ribosomal protein S27AE
MPDFFHELCPAKHWMREPEDDTCPRCGGSFKATGGKPAPNYPYQCQKCTADDWLEAEAQKSLDTSLNRK